MECPEGEKKMIPFDLIYAKPESVEEAVDAFMDFERKGKSPLYYAGGTEIVTFCRKGLITPGAVIDLKGIPQCLEMKEIEQDIILGSALTLNEVIEGGLFPLLSEAGSAIADHTVRNQITLGGNITGRLPYREGILPMLVAEAAVECAGPDGGRTIIVDVSYNGKLSLAAGEFVVRFTVKKSFASTPYFYRRKTQYTRVDYPLVTGCFLKKDGAIRMALSGACSFPVRSKGAEEIINDYTLDLETKPDEVVKAIHVPIKDDFRATSGYRRMLLKDMIGQALKGLEEE
jgi:CO/xanthine dehydrogenase FAD-binding subunit